MLFTVSFEKLFAASIIAAATAVGAQTTNDGVIFSNDPVSGFLSNGDNGVDTQGHGQGELYSERALRGSSFSSEKKRGGASKATSRDLKKAKGSKKDKKSKCLPEDPTTFRTKFRKSLGCPEYSAPLTVGTEYPNRFRDIVTDCLEKKEDCPHGWPLGCWNTTEVTDMSEAFNWFYVGEFNDPIEGWDVSRVTNMVKMFQYQPSFNQPLQRWDTRKVTDLSKMFTRSTEFNQPIDCWNTTKNLYFDTMFYYAKKFDQPIGNWDVSNAVRMHQLFNGAESFNQPLDNWNPMTTASTYYMFEGALSFNQCLSSWATKAVSVVCNDSYENAYAMFKNTDCADPSDPTKKNCDGGVAVFDPNDPWCGCSE